MYVLWRRGPCFGTDASQIPESYSCGPFFDDWLSHTDHVYLGGTGNASSEISAEPHCDLGTPFTKLHETTKANADTFASY